MNINANNWKSIFIEVEIKFGIENNFQVKQKFIKEIFTKKLLAGFFWKV